MADDASDLRRDAARNRELILDAARELFAEQGLGVSFDVIARTAGVGNATLYRRFPTRKDLVDAVVRRCLDETAALVERSLGSADPWEGIREFVFAVGEMHEAGEGLSDALASVLREDEHWIGHPIESLLDQLASRARRARGLRPGVTGSDVCMCASAVAHLADHARQTGYDWRRFADVVLDGLRPRLRAADR